MKKQTSIDDDFPYETLPWKLIFDDRGAAKKCFFMCEEHLKKHMERYKLNKKNSKVSHKNGLTLT